MVSAELEAADPCDRPVEFPMFDAIHSAVWPYSDTPAPEVVAGEKDACGVGFLAQLQGKASHWVLEQALRGLGCMEHRGVAGEMATPETARGCCVKFPGRI